MRLGAILHCGKKGTICHRAIGSHSSEHKYSGDPLGAEIRSGALAKPCMRSRWSRQTHESFCLAPVLGVPRGPWPAPFLQLVDRRCDSVGASIVLSQPPQSQGEPVGQPFLKFLHRGVSESVCRASGFSNVPAGAGCWTPCGASKLNRALKKLTASSDQNTLRFPTSAAVLQV
jgi:hypothetical protein